MMDFSKKNYCDAQLIRFLEEKDLIREDGSYSTISVTSFKKKEQMIFFGKSDTENEFEVRVYKARPEDRYVHHVLDKCKRIIENDEYAEFVFENFEDMKDFVDWINYRHMEYAKRPKAKKVE